MMMPMPARIRWAAFLLSAIAIALAANPLCADDTVAERTDLPTLVELVIRNDPALEALRRAIAAADFEIAGSARGRSPEIRVRYGQTSDNEGSGTSTTEDESSQYTVQLRLFPRNPWIKRAEVNRELALKDHAEMVLNAALQRAALSVAREHREIQFMLAELQRMRRLETLLRSDLLQLADMKKAKSIAAADYHKRHAEALVYLSRISELKRNILDANARLKTRAGLGEDARIAYAGSLSPPRVDFDALDPSRLVELARPRHQGLLSLRSEQSSIRSEISAERAAAVPWLSFVSADYGVDDAANGQTRDEWSVYAGIELPVGVWLDGASRRALNARLRSARRQELLTEHQLALVIGDMCRALAAAQSEWASFADKTRSARRNVEQQMAKIDDDDLAAHRTRISLSASLLAMDMRRLELAHTISDLFFDLCDTIGYDLSAVPGK